jgi:L-arabinose isomerase
LRGARRARCPSSRTSSCAPRIPFRQVTGVLGDDPAAWNEIAEWMRAANVVQGLAHNRLGLMGHYYSGMLDIATDLTALCTTFRLL